MKQSQLFGKTNKNAKEFSSINATLLIKGGFIDQTMAGGYTYLTLGTRVMNKIETIIREEMNKISSEVLMPCIVPTQLWETTGRLETVDVLMKTKPANKAATEKNDTEYILNSTHEEVVTPLAQKYYPSYKDLPLSVYQINTKFRNEPRAKSGLLRCREFRMKDMYSFHTSAEDLKAYYEVAKKAYWQVYERLGIKESTYIALASGGDFTDDYSHEYQTRCDTGEDILFHVPGKNLTFNREVAPSQAPPAGSPDEEMQEKAEFTGSATGVVELAKQMGIPVEKTVKTLLYEDEAGKIYAVAIRGNYEADTEKIKKITGATTLAMASAATLERLGTVAGYIGAHGLPEEVTVLWDDSTRDTRNFEIGGNKLNSHWYNLNWGRDIPEPAEYYDLKVAQEGDYYPETGEQYEVFRAAEVGNIFPLYTKFTKAFNYRYIDENNQAQDIYMGCYGIGSSRIMGVIAEKYHDENGLVWPAQIAPFTVHLIALQQDDAEMREKAGAVYKQLTDAGIEVLFDDRADVRPGEKFADADLIGIPYRAVISKKTGEQVEVKRRSEGKESATLIRVEELVQEVLP
ncbi:MAG: proline--tRNA ligase [Patescibacteria group bacterium]